MKKRILPLLLLPLFFLGSCGGGASGDGLPELEENIIDDNYRNYYEIFVAAYSDSDGDGWGDIKGIINKLDYIRDLGYTGLWLTPIFTSNSIHKYNASDYYQVDPRFGTNADLEELITECHDRDIKLILDLVLNHSSRSAEYYTKAVSAHARSLSGLPLTDEEEKYKDFYVFYDTEDAARNAGVEAYYQVSGQTFYYEGNFSQDMPEFNFDSTYVWEEFENIMKHYLEMGVDGFRLDAVKYYYYTSQAKTIEALSKIKTIANKYNSNNYIVGECWSGDGVISSYYDSGIDSFFYFPSSSSNPSGGFINESLMLDGAYKQSFYKGVNAMMASAKEYIPAPFLDNHDMARIATSDEVTTKMVYGLLSMLNGTTFTYYGDEIGMACEGGTDANARTPMDWGDKNITTDNLSGGESSSDFGNVNRQLKNSNSILNYYKKANHLRNSLKSIARGEMLNFEAPDVSGNRLVTMTKKYEDETITIVFNFSKVNTLEYSTELQLIGTLLVNSKDKIESTDNTYTIPSYGIAIFK